MGFTDTLFGIDDDKLQALYHRDWIEANHGFVDPRKYPYVPSTNIH